MTDRINEKNTAQNAAKPELKKLAPGAETVLVAIDGPAGSGKSSVAKASAVLLGYGTLDTGAAYRALTLHLMQQGVDAVCEAAVLEALAAVEIDLPFAATYPVRLNGTDVSAQIRTAEVTSRVSKITGYASVRAALNERFRRRVATSQIAGVVIEGRDITSVVAPDAPVRIILTADAAVRAARRQGELSHLSVAQVQADLLVRDAKDMQNVDFMNPLPGVELIDTSEMNFAQAVAAVVQCVRAKLAG
ncbi:(d)CMP kinase [Canibacter sp. lx-45]|uniref:(d)CMP kinase n=1 Tax=Canibacter zhuwentaonis TaxID=2837491 RepID=UPI001BDC828A|nr:(d)CMP kinase [Canibacter zhuwentaonis]MBT1035574.1 (d)CMP kinase [Canibacter zhuwentaonis]